MYLYRLSVSDVIVILTASGSEKNYFNNTGLYFCCIACKNQCIRKAVREFELSNETWGIAKSIACRITSVKQCAATPTLLLLHTQDRSYLDRKLNIKLQSASSYLL